MAGYYNQTIYTKEDNPWCESCLNATFIKSDEFILMDGGYWCHCKGVPTDEGCEEYRPK